MPVRAPAMAGASPGGSDDDRGDPLGGARERIEAGAYRAPLERLETLQAERYYTRALALDSEHLDANEYLGELYPPTDRPRLARECLRVLDDACFFGREACAELEATIRAYEARSD